jgi:hypothetical protein
MLKNMFSQEWYFLQISNEGFLEGSGCGGIFRPQAGLFPLHIAL